MTLFDENDYDPKRFGISYNPPQIVVEYNKVSRNKLYHHKIKIKNLSKETKISDIVDEIYKKHGPYLNNKKINKVKIIQLIEKLRQKYFEKKESEEKINSEKKVKKTVNDYKKDFDLNENLNLLSKEELDKKKKKMDEYYEQNNIKVGDKNFQYDVRKDFDNKELPAEWDDDEDDDDYI